jgi:hypothetical protein
MIQCAVSGHMATVCIVRAFLTLGRCVFSMAEELALACCHRLTPYYG